MNFEEFVNRIKESIRDYLPREYENAEVLVQEQQKLNNRYTGLLVLREGGTMTPTVNMEQLFDYYNGEDFSHHPKRSAWLKYRKYLPV